MPVKDEKLQRSHHKCWISRGWGRWDLLHLRDCLHCIRALGHPVCWGPWTRKKWWLALGTSKNRSPNFGNYDKMQTTPGSGRRILHAIHVLVHKSQVTVLWQIWWYQLKISLLSRFDSKFWEWYGNNEDKEDREHQQIVMAIIMTMTMTCRNGRAPCWCWPAWRWFHCQRR